jgi:hypothetical protein
MPRKTLVIVSALSLALAACGDNSNKPATAPAGPAAPAAAPTAQDLKAAADKALADLQQYIKDNKWDLADKGVAELDKLRPNLPPEYGPRIDQIKQALAAAKAAAAKLPASLPKLP